MNGGPGPLMNESVVLPGGTGYDDSPSTPILMPAPSTDPQPQIAPPTEAPNNLPTPPQSGDQSTSEDIDITLPVVTDDQFLPPHPVAAQPASTSVPPAKPVPPPTVPPQAPQPSDATYFNPFTPTAPQVGQGGMPVYTAPRPYSPQRQPVFMRNASRPYNPQSQHTQPDSQQGQSGLIGPVGYDVQ